MFLLVDLIDRTIKPQEILTSPEYESTEYSSLLTKLPDYYIKKVKKVCTVKTQGILIDLFEGIIVHH